MRLVVEFIFLEFSLSCFLFMFGEVGFLSVRGFVLLKPSVSIMGGSEIRFLITWVGVRSGNGGGFRVRFGDRGMGVGGGRGFLGVSGDGGEERG